MQKEDKMEIKRDNMFPLPYFTALWWWFTEKSPIDYHTKNPSMHRHTHTLEIFFSYYKDLQARPLSMPCSLLTHRREPNVLAHTYSLILFNTWKVPMLDSLYNWFNQSPRDGRCNKQSHCEAMLADFGGGTVVAATLDILTLSVKCTFRKTAATYAPTQKTAKCHGSKTTSRIGNP